MQSQDDRKISEKGSVHFSALSHLSISSCPERSHH